jgi:hypothetical protein
MIYSLAMHDVLSLERKVRTVRDKMEMGRLPRLSRDELDGVLLIIEAWRRVSETDHVDARATTLPSSTTSIAAKK